VSRRVIKIVGPAVGSAFGSGFSVDGPIASDSLLWGSGGGCDVVVLDSGCEGPRVKAGAGRFSISTGVAVCCGTWELVALEAIAGCALGRRRRSWGEVVVRSNDGVMATPQQR